MKLILFLLAVLLVAGCATDSQGRKESAWEAMKRWDESMTNTENRIQDKTYRD